MPEVSKTVERMSRYAGTVARGIGRAALHLMPGIRPDYVMDDVHDLTPEMLAETSPTTHVVIFDIEGTLENYKEPNVSEKTAAMIRRLQKAGYIVAINSNAPDEKRTTTVHEMFDELTGKDFVFTSYDAKQAGYRHGGKPFTSMIDMVEKAVKESGSSWTRQHFLMVGDQLAKDTLSGINGHTRTMYVNRYGDGDNKNVLRWQRPPEYHYLRALGMPAVAFATGKYKPVELPKDMTLLSDYRKTVQRRVQEREAA